MPRDWLRFHCRKFNDSRRGGRANTFRPARGRALQEGKDSPRPGLCEGGARSEHCHILCLLGIWTLLEALASEEGTMASECSWEQHVDVPVRGPKKKNLMGSYWGHTPL